MLCLKARKRLIDYNWDKDLYSKDAALIEHLQKCKKCQNLILAEDSINKNFVNLSNINPPQGLEFNVLRQRLSNLENQSFSKYKLHPKYVYGMVIALLLLLAFIPFDVTETVGYEVAISGIDRNIALNNQEVPSLLDALGMEPKKISSLLDSIERKEIYLSVGDCEETCDLKISDLKTERDAHLVINAIIELGCCEIEKLIPIIKNRSTNLLKQTAKQLFS